MDLAELLGGYLLAILYILHNLLIVQVVPEAVTRHDDQVALLHLVLEFGGDVGEFVAGAALVRKIEAPLLDGRVEDDLAVAVDEVAAVAEVEAVDLGLVLVDDH